LPDWITLSKVLPQLLYPFNLSLLFLLAALLLVLFGKRWKGAFLIFLSLGILGVGASPLSTMLYRSHEQQYPAISAIDSPSAGAIVVLGGDVGIPSTPRAESQINGNRLLHAFRLYRAGKAPMIMIAGGNVFPQEGLEAEAVYSQSILEEMGVPRQAILIETKSRNTRENGLETRQVLGGLGVDRILLVTSGLHMPRAVRVFEKVGFEVVASTAAITVVDFAQPTLLDWWPSLGNLKKAESLIREKIGLFVYWLRGWV